MTSQQAAMSIIERTALRKMRGLIPDKYDVVPLPMPNVRVPDPCVLRGDPLTGLEREVHGLDHLRLWVWCLHPERPLGRAVCVCTGCGPGCKGYDDGKPPPPEPRRHLAFHIYPHARQKGLAWRMAIDQLRMRWSLFDGNKVVAICTGENLDSPDTVRAYLPFDCEVIEVRNDSGLREVKSWLPLWERILAGAEDHDAALYCHTKGVTRPVDPGNSTQWWASLSWSLVLDHWPLVAQKLRRRPIVGPFKKLGYGFGRSFGRWHYSGTFFWLNVGDFRAYRINRPVPAMWWGVEAWPGLAYDAADAEVLFIDGKVPHLDLYCPSFWTQVIRPEYTKWLLQNRPAWPGVITNSRD